MLKNWQNSIANIVCLVLSVCYLGLWTEYSINRVTLEDRIVTLEDKISNTIKKMPSVQAKPMIKMEHPSRKLAEAPLIQKFDYVSGCTASMGIWIIPNGVGQ